MSDEEVVSFLKGDVDNTSNLLKLFSKLLACEFVAMFLKLDSGYNFQGKYRTTERICTIKKVRFQPMLPFKESVFSNESNSYKQFGLYCETYKKEDVVRNVMIHPVENAGVLVFVNSEEDFSDISMENTDSLMSLCGLVMRRKRVLKKYEAINSDTTYFSKDVFLANISHEIRTPLNGVIGYNQLLMRTNLTSEQERYLIRMNHCSIQLMQIINDVLDYSRITSGSMTVKKTSISLSRIIETCKSALGQKISSKNQVCTYTVSGDIPEYIVIDGSKLTQIVVNLMSNANKFTDIHGIISVKFSLRDMFTLVIEVRDNGIGISEENQCKLFNSFVQIEDSVTKSGSGLGLAISKKLAELMGGELSVTSVEGRGSCFTCATDFETDEQYKQELVDEMKSLEHSPVLIVDDNVDNRIILTELMIRWKVKATICSSAKEALQYVRSNILFDMALIDICMPGVSGIELAKQIKEIRPSLSLIALSSIDQIIDESRFSCVVKKPFNIVNLLDAMTRIIKNTVMNTAFIGDMLKYPQKILDNSLSKLPNPENVRILIAEDVENNRVLLVKMLETFGYTLVDQVCNGLEAVKMLDKAHNINIPYDILFLDLRMPVMNGYSVIEYMDNKEYKKPRIITVTACVLQNDRDKCKSMGVQYFINKPVQIVQLGEVLTHVRKDLDSL
jgi:CheY-like chemotaxis protein